MTDKVPNPVLNFPRTEKCPCDSMLQFQFCCKPKLDEMVTPELAAAGEKFLKLMEEQRAKVQ